MGIFKDRSNFFKNIAIKNKQVAHTVLVDGEARNSFHRLNDEEELQSACVNYAHFPCFVHFGFDGRYTSDINAMPKRKLNNDFIILSKVDNVADMNDREDAYDEAFEIVEQIISFMLNQVDTLGSCGPFANFDLARVSFQRYALNGNLFGWLVSFEDEVYANEVNVFDASKWY